MNKMKRTMKVMTSLTLIFGMSLILIACQKKVPIADAIIGPSPYFTEQQIKEAIEIVEQAYQEEEFVASVSRVEFNEAYSLEQLALYAEMNGLDVDEMKDDYLLISTDMKTTKEPGPLESNTKYPYYDFLLRYDEKDGWQLVSGGTGLLT